MTDAPVTLNFKIGPGGLIPDPDDDRESGPPVPAEAFVGENGHREAGELPSDKLIRGLPPAEGDTAAPEPITMPAVTDEVGWIGEGGAVRYPAKVVRKVGPTLEDTPAGGKETLPVLDLFVFGPEPHGGYRRNIHHVSRVNMREEEHWVFIGRDYL